MKSLIIRVLFLATILLVQYNSIKATRFKEFDSSKMNLFATDLLPLVAGNKSTANVVYSPASIYTSLALTYLGAKGRTADEISTVLKLDENDKINFATIFGRFLRTNLKKNTPRTGVPQLTMSNRFYVSNKIKILEKFNEIAQENFDSTAENIDFSQALTAVEKINKWVEHQTKNKIKNLIKLDEVNFYTRAILVNTIYFKASWMQPFLVAATRKNKFHINRSESVEVDTMCTTDYNGYAELPDLEAEALDLAYQKSDISMLIIIPKDIEGLNKLEERLKGIDLNEIASKIRQQELKVFLPKFRIEFDIDLQEPLKKLGCFTMFSEEANFMGMFKTNISHAISDIKQKVFLECNEYGSEATSATYTNIEEELAYSYIKVVRVDRPFFFAIRSSNGVFFAGHVARP